MFCFRLICDCGYSSAVVCWGSVPGSRDDLVVMPIFNPETGMLCGHQFHAGGEGEDDENAVVWWEKHGPAVRELYGDKACVLIPAEYDAPLVSCPVCHRMTCRAVSAGIV